MPVMDGVTAISLIRERFPEIKVIALTSFSEEKLVEKSLQAGAIGYLFKNASVDDLAASIRAARIGDPTLAPEATKILIEKATHPPSTEEKLTQRELEVLQLLVDGHTNPEIAEILAVSRSTIKTHVSHILDKFGVESRLEAVTYAIRHKMVT